MLFFPKSCSCPITTISNDNFFFFYVCLISFYYLVQCGSLNGQCVGKRGRKRKREGEWLNRPDYLDTRGDGSQPLANFWLPCLSSKIWKTSGQRENQSWRIFSSRSVVSLSGRGWVPHGKSYGLLRGPNLHPFLTLLPFLFVFTILAANLVKAKTAVLNRNIYKASRGKGGGRWGTKMNSTHRLSPLCLLLHIPLGLPNSFEWHITQHHMYLGV